MSLTPDDFEPFAGDDDETPLGESLAELAVDIDVDSVDAVRELREDV